MSYLNLSKITLDILLILAMLTNLERLFFNAKVCITKLKNKLGIDILKAFKCLKSWYKIQGFREGSKFQEEIFGI
jgi:hypothetical protein